MSRPQPLDLDDHTHRLIRFKARQVARQLNLTIQDRKDLEQDLYLDLWRRLPKYRARRGRKKTFIALVVDRCVATWIARYLGKRTREVLTGTNWDNLPCHPPRRDPDLIIDLERALNALPPVLRELSARLTHQTVTEIARELGIARATLYDQINRLRRLCQKPLRPYRISRGWRRPPKT
jgi:RNA polymerase sigma-70 factor (ECF subfamily)